MVGRTVTLNLLDQLEPSPIGHGYIGDNKVGELRWRKWTGIATVFSRYDFIDALQFLAYITQDILLIVHDEYFEICFVWNDWRDCRSRRRRRKWFLDQYVFIVTFFCQLVCG